MSVKSRILGSYTFVSSRTLVVVKLILKRPFKRCGIFSCPRERWKNRGRLLLECADVRSKWNRKILKILPAVLKHFSVHDRNIVVSVSKYNYLEVKLFMLYRASYSPLYVKGFWKQEFQKRVVKTERRRQGDKEPSAHYRQKIGSKASCNGR